MQDVGTVSASEIGKVLAWVIMRYVALLGMASGFKVRSDILLYAPLEVVVCNVFFIDGDVYQDIYPSSNMPLHGNTVVVCTLHSSWDYTENSVVFIIRVDTTPEGELPYVPLLSVVSGLPFGMVRVSMPNPIIQVLQRNMLEHDLYIRTRYSSKDIISSLERIVHVLLEIRSNS